MGLLVVEEQLGCRFMILFVPMGLLVCNLKKTTSKGLLNRNCPFRIAIIEGYKHRQIFRQTLTTIQQDVYMELRGRAISQRAMNLAREVANKG